MNRLYILRHGVAVAHGTPGVEEDERPLTPKGERRVRQIARGLRTLGLKLDKIVTSPLPRALQTAELVADVLGVAYLVEQDDVLRPGNDAHTIRQWLSTRTEARLMIVGHDPAFSELVGLLVTGELGRPVCELKKGGIAALRDHPGGGYRLDWLARPRLIRRLAN